MNKQQNYILDEEQIQVILTGTFGDGNIGSKIKLTANYSTCCIKKGYLQYKKNLLKDICIREPRTYINNGFKKAPIHVIHTKFLSCIKDLHNKTIKEKLYLMTPLGLAMWFYDDGSLHKSNHFYNLNTHCFSEEVHVNILVPYFESLGFKPKVFRDNKKDGRSFCYLYFGKHYGAFEITKLLRKYFVAEFEYKMWPSETIHKWGKLQEELISQNKVVSKRMFSDMLKKVIL